MEKDKVEYIGSSLIHHGKANDRIYLMKPDLTDMPFLVTELDELAEKNCYSKIFAKVPSSFKEDFISAGYEVEAVVPCFYSGKDDAVFLAKFLSGGRREEADPERLRGVISAAKEKAEEPPTQVPPGVAIRKAGPADIADMARVYAEVFASYPFPINDPQYLLDTMKSHVIYFVATKGNELVAVSSAETDREASNAEMTDFATMPEYRGQGLAGRLLSFMDEYAASERIMTGYTIARSRSYGMNITFARGGYSFAGTLVNNTNICGQIESMNVWYKALGERN